MSITPNADSKRRRTTRLRIALLVTFSLLAAATFFVYVLVQPRLAGARQHEGKALTGWRWEPSDRIQLGSAGVAMDLKAVGRPISPLIYGVAAADAVDPTRARCDARPLRWQPLQHLQLGQRARLERRPGLAVPQRQLRSPGSAADDGVAATLAAGAVRLLTVPTMG